MRRFAFYGRVSTEDQQDPQSSRAWQLRRSKDLIEPSASVVVAEFFDGGSLGRSHGSGDPRLRACWSPSGILIGASRPW